MTDRTNLHNGAGLGPAPRLAGLGVFGATAAFTALAIGSGELMFWPGLVVSIGAGVIWLAIAIVALQWFVNIEVARYTLASGESVGRGFARHAPVVAVLLVLGAIVPWLWPGWIRAGGQMIAAVTGGPEKWISVAILAVCAAALLVPARAYRLLESAQTMMLAVILIGILWLFAVVATATGGIGGFASRFLAFEGIGQVTANLAAQQDSAYFGLLGGVVFAGAGGILNLGYSYLVLERNRAYSHSAANSATVPEPGRWAAWMSLLRREHAILFVGGNATSIVFLSALFFMIFGQAGTNVSGMTLLSATYDRIAEAYGSGNAVLFGIVGFLVFFTSALGILHLTCFIASDLVRALLKQNDEGSEWIFKAFVMAQSAVALALIFLDPRQPFWLITTAAFLNTLVMALYGFGIVWMNRRTLSPVCQPGLLSEAMVVLLGSIYLALFGLTAWKLL